MRRDQLEHAIRTACQIIGHEAVVVVGSQSILGSLPDVRPPGKDGNCLFVDGLTVVRAVFVRSSALL